MRQIVRIETERRRWIMPPTFDAKEFVARLGRSLVREFEEARQATTGPLKGAAVETPARKRLQQILPRGIAVGSGCVIDTIGNCSKQQDVVLYERDVCPVFSVNDTPDTTYYPCEGVLGVIEIKSSLDTASLKDSFEKMASVRDLRRRGLYRMRGVSGETLRYFRRYQNAPVMHHVEFADPPDVHDRGLDQIFGAVLSGGLRITADTLSAKFAELRDVYGADNAPNMIEVLDGGTLVPCRLEGDVADMMHSARNATHTIYAETDPLRHLIQSIYRHHREGVTSPTDAFDRYVADDQEVYSGRMFPMTSAMKPAQ